LVVDAIAVRIGVSIDVRVAPDRGLREERPHGALNQITPAAYAAGVGPEQRESA
jgi:hypothetical protein